MGIFNDGWEDEVYRLKARIKELEKENKSLREQLSKRKTQTVSQFDTVFKEHQPWHGYTDEL